MSDLIGVAKSGDYAAYEAAVKKLVVQVGCAVAANHLGTCQ